MHYINTKSTYRIQVYFNVYLLFIFSKTSQLFILFIILQTYISIIFQFSFLLFVFLYYIS